MARTISARLASAEIIAAILRQQGSLNTLLPAFSEKVNSRDRAFLKELCYGTLRSFPRIDCIMSVLLKKPLREKDYDLYGVIATAIHQLDETRVPAHAAINEAVATTLLLNKNWARGLVNGVLRNYQRQRKQLQNDPALTSLIPYQTAHPEWLVKLWQQDWPNNWQAIIDANNSHPPMTLRINTRLTSRDAYHQQLVDAGIHASATDYSRDGLTLATPAPVESLPGFEKGWCSVQDEAAQLAAFILRPSNNERVLDACCAPGGKFCHLIEMIGEGGEVHGVELDQQRLARVDQNYTRLFKDCSDLPRVATFCATAADPEHWWDGAPYQKILLDAPCSATGVIRRNPDIKLLRSTKQVAELASLQLHLLQSLWPLLAEGGQLLYATCSTLKQENDRVIAQFLEKNTNVSMCRIAGEWGIATEYGRQLFPQQDGPDGFYYALLQKRS